MKDLRDLASTMRMVAEDCKRDSENLDGVPFNGREIGARLGEHLAMIAACAKGVAIVADELAQRETP